MKLCSKCLTEKEESSFYRKRGKLDSWCKDCNKVWYQKDPIARKQTRQLHYANNHEDILNATKDRYYANVIVSRERNKKFREHNPDYAALWYQQNREYKLAHGAQWKKNNPDRVVLSGGSRRKLIKQATPMWARLDEWERFFLKEIYSLAQIRTRVVGINHEVDHHVPIVSNKVCGLHVSANLQILTKTDNSKKSNSVWTDMPNEPRIHQ